MAKEIGKGRLQLFSADLVMRGAYDAAVANGGLLVLMIFSGVFEIGGSGGIAASLVLLSGLHEGCATWIGACAWASSGGGLMVCHVSGPPLEEAPQSAHVRLSGQVGAAPSPTSPDPPCATT